MGDPRREEYRAVALRTVDRLLAEAQDDDDGMFHLLAPDGTRGEKGLLADQLWMAQAALDAYAHTGDPDYRTQAQRIAAFMLRTLLAPTGFRDRPLDEHDFGLLAEPVYSLPDNGGAAELFLRLAWLTARRRTSGSPGAFSPGSAKPMRRKVSSRRATHSPGRGCTASRAMS